MDQLRKDAFDRLERIGYLPEMRKLATSLCAPFWWHGRGDDGRYRILHNGTVCFLNTGVRLIGVTADHVYREYLKDKARYSAFACQFGESTIEPEKRLIHRDEYLDLATFDLSEVFVGATGRSIHYLPNWPTQPLRERETVLFGGYPGILREEKPMTAELPFQTFATAVTAVSPDNIKLHLDMPNVYWPFHEGEEFNSELGGLSHGPVFRIVEAPPIDRLELVGFIYEYSPNLEVMFARPASQIARDGRVVYEYLPAV